MEMPTSAELVMELAKEVARLEVRCKELEAELQEKDEELAILIHVLASYHPEQPEPSEQD